MSPLSLAFKFRQLTLLKCLHPACLDSSICGHNTASQSHSIKGEKFALCNSHERTAFHQNKTLHNLQSRIQCSWSRVWPENCIISCKFSWHENYLKAFQVLQDKKEKGSPKLVDRIDGIWSELHPWVCTGYLGCKLLDSRCCRIADPFTSVTSPDITDSKIFQRMAQRDVFLHQWFYYQVFFWE